jgi:[protein-PII] uridylyltransferase
MDKTPLSPELTVSASDLANVDADRCDLFAPALDKLSTPAELGAYLKEWHTRINSPGCGRDTVLLAHNTALVDAVLRRIFALAVEKADNGDLTAPTPELVIVATGGYGRRELCPYSDVDVTFVPAREDDDRLNAIIKDMFQLVMDVFLYGANLKVGYAYRLISDLGQLDHQTQTTLLDSRYLCGDRELFKAFRNTFRSQILLLAADFMFQKWAERKSVLAKFGGDNVYGVEPNIKEGAGCLRDIHNAEWIAEVRFRAAQARVWATLAEQNVISDEDAAAVRRAREFLLRVRCELHIVAGEARDVLTTEKQEAVAARLGYVDEGEVPAVESFMREVYMHMATARKISRKVIARCLDSEIDLGLGLMSRGRKLYISDPNIADGDSALPLHAIEMAQAYGLKISEELEEDIAEFLKRHPSPSDTQAVGRVFARLLSAPLGVADSVERLEDMGVLAWFLPEFGPLMTLIPYDAAHDYTVGAHSLRVLRNMEDLRTTDDPKLAEYRRVAGEISMREVLYLTALLHDVGKQWPEAGHAETGARAVIDIVDRLGWDTERRDRMVFLVREHLLMAETSRLRDLALDETVREFVKDVPDMDALNMLYLLTYADTSAVGQGVWTEVKGKFLTELYYRSEQMLAAAEQGETPTYVPNVARHRERIRKQLSQHNLPIDLIHEHTRNLPAQYLLNTPLEEMYLHISMIGRLRETFTPIVDFKHEFGSDFTEMTLCAYDDPSPGLLAKITGVLYACDINVHVAQVFTREASVRIAIDTLWVDYRGKPLSSTKKAEVQDSIRKVLLGELPLAELLKQRKKPIKEQTIYSALIDDTTSDRFSVLEVSAPDEKGVVYRLASAISSVGWNIHAARISVWGSRARDAFYITDTQNKKVSAADVQRLLDLLPTTSYVKRKLVATGK